MGPRVWALMGAMGSLAVVGCGAGQASTPTSGAAAARASSPTAAAASSAGVAASPTAAASATPGRRVGTLTLRGGASAPQPTSIASVAPGLTTLTAPADRWLTVRGPLRELSTTTSKAFGQGMRVVTSSLSGNGMYVFLWDWSAKKDSQGHSGNIAVVRPFQGDEERFEGLVARDRLARHHALIQDGKLWLLDTETDQRQRLGGADIDLENDTYSRSQDESQFGLSTYNRQVAFSADGTALTYHRNRPERVVLRDLASKAEAIFDVPAGWFVWRAEPGDSPGSVRAFLVRSPQTYRRGAPSREVPPDMAQELCGTAVAEMLEYPGLDNVEYHSDAAGRLRARGSVASGAERSYAFGVDFWFVKGGLRKGAAPVPSAIPCIDQYYSVFLNAHVIAHSCDDMLWVQQPARGQLLVNPREDLHFERSGASYAHHDSAGVPWAMVRHEHRGPDRPYAEKVEHVGRMRLDTAAIEYASVPHIKHEARCRLYADPQFEWTPWRAGINRDTFFLMSLADGTLYETPVPARYRGIDEDLARAQPGIVVAPRYLGFYGLDDFPGWVASSGCVFQTSAPKRKLTEGPWRVTCPTVAVRAPRPR